jgi:2-hydroxychromene-2-carboxylate isomerase
MATLGVYLDLISPYAYLGWHRVHAIAARHGRAVEPRPVLFAAMLDALGQRGPAEIPPKRVYTFKHVVRLAHDYGIAIAPPPSHPFNPLTGLRVAIAALGTDHARATIDALFAAVWCGGPGVEDAGALAAWLDAQALPGAGLVERASSAEVKAELRARTDAAIAAGVFGVPTFDVDGELFWGQDALPHVDAALAGHDPAREVAAAWIGVRPTASRPGAAR